jgi:aryl-alcohol dehydrogenase-like predicted oxidoreductase
MSSSKLLGGTFTFKGTGKTVNRIGYGAIHLPGPMVWGEPENRPEAIAVVKEVISLGINHIDTSDYYGPHVANQIIKDAIFPYPKDLVIVTKVGAKRGPDKSWLVALSEEELTLAVEQNLSNLGLKSLDIVNLRVGLPMGTNEASIGEPLKVLVKLKEQGLIRNIGLSNISYKQYKESERITDIVCVQNHYNVAYRKDDALIDELAAKGIAFAPFFPLGGFMPIQSETLERIADSIGESPKKVALAWLLQRSENILLISGTSSVAHLRENIQAGSLALSQEALFELNQIGVA